MARKLGPEEKALWGRVVETVKPLRADRPVKSALPTPPPQQPAAQNVRRPALDAGRGFTAIETGLNGQKAKPRVKHGVTLVKAASALNSALDSTWDRRITKGGIVPDISVDLHETNLSGAYARLDRTLEQAIHQKLRVILLVTGKPRGHDRASGQGRGAIAAVVRDWLAASRHASHISAVRQAHPRHGGDGALYIVLKK